MGGYPNGSLLLMNPLGSSRPPLLLRGSAVNPCFDGCFSLPPSRRPSNGSGNSPGSEFDVRRSTAAKLSERDRQDLPGGAPQSIARRLRSAFKALPPRLSLYCASLARLLHVSCTSLPRLYPRARRAGPGLVILPGRLLALSANFGVLNSG